MSTQQRHKHRHVVRDSPGQRKIDERSPAMKRRKMHTPVRCLRKQAERGLDFRVNVEGPQSSRKTLFDTPDRKENEQRRGNVKESRTPVFEDEDDEEEMLGSMSNYRSTVKQPNRNALTTNMLVRTGKRWATGNLGDKSTAKKAPSNINPFMSLTDSNSKSFHSNMPANSGIFDYSPNLDDDDHDRSGMLLCGTNSPPSISRRRFSSASTDSLILPEESPFPPPKHHSHHAARKYSDSPNSLCQQLKRTCSLAGPKFPGMDFDEDEDEDDDNKHNLGKKDDEEYENKTNTSGMMTAEEDDKHLIGDVLIDEEEDESYVSSRSWRVKKHPQMSKTPQPPPPVPVKKQPQQRRRTIGAAMTDYSIDEYTDVRQGGKYSRYKEEFEELGVLGGGSFGTVYKCRNRLDGCLYAVKVTKQRFKGKADRERVLKEVYALSAICNTEDNPHIVRYFSAFVEDGRLYIQTELCDRSLQDIIRKGDYPGGIEHTCKEMARQVLEGLAKLHKHNLVHLDIKPANIFVKNGTFKVGDLGHASIVRMQTEKVVIEEEDEVDEDDDEDENGYGRQYHDPLHAMSPIVGGQPVSPILRKNEDTGRLPAPPPLDYGAFVTPAKPFASPVRYSPGPTPLNDSDFDMDFLDKSNVSAMDDIEEGDSRYMAWEILNEDYTNITKGDIFSLGASMYEMCLGRELPANGPEWHDIRNGILLEGSLARYSPYLQQLIRLMLTKDPVVRPSAQTLLTSGGPGGILRTEYENKLAREKAAADEYRKQLARMKSNNGAPTATVSIGNSPDADRFRMRRSMTM